MELLVGPFKGIATFQYVGFMVFRFMKWEISSGGGGGPGGCGGSPHISQVVQNSESSGFLQLLARLTAPSLVWKDEKKASSSW